jgi:Lipid desaturase domain
VKRELAAGYAPVHRIYEQIGIGAATVCGAWLAVCVARDPLVLHLALLASIVGLLVADFVSGLIHWACDTWGSTRTPLLGPLAIRTFREHHHDARAILRHDFVETNGHNFALAAPLFVAGLYVASPFARVCLFATGVFVAMTSQIHKWAHMEAPPRLVRALQRCKILLGPSHHDGHHVAPHTQNYCITVGWLDRPLAALRFWHGLERLVTALTGRRPRAS